MTLVRLAPLALVALLAASCGDKDKSSNQTTTTATTPATSLAGATNEPPSSAGNRLAVGKRDLYPLLAGSLAGYVSKPVRATSTTVSSCSSAWAEGSSSGSAAC